MMNKELQQFSSTLNTSTQRSSVSDAHSEVAINNYFVSTLKNHLSNNLKCISRSSLFIFGSARFVTSMPYDYPTTSKLQTSAIRVAKVSDTSEGVRHFLDRITNDLKLFNICASLIICFYFFSYTTLQAQPVINNDILPKIGDTVILASDNLPEGIAIFSEEGQQDWDFMDLQSAFSKKVVVKKVAQYKGDFLFPNADIKIEDLSGIENYYHLHKNELKLVGTNGVDPYGLGIEMQTTYDPAFVTLKTPMAYGDIANTSGQFTSTLAANKLPITLLYSLPILPDSVRFVSSIERSQEIDAWGHLVLPDNSFEVVRERRITAIKTRLEVKVGLFPWRDITDEMYTTRFPKEQIKLSYHFYSNETSMPVATVTMKPDGVNAASINYIVTDPTSTMRNTTGKPDIYAYPNPAINDVRFEFSNLPPARYTMKIFNILGVPIMEKSYQLSGFKTIKWDVSKLRKGTYLYSLVNEKGNPIATKRLMVIRP